MTTNARNSSRRPTGVEAREFRLALTRLPGLVKAAIRVFNEVTGFTAVASFDTLVPHPARSDGIPPPMHPLCIARLRTTGGRPCKHQWQEHLDSSLRSPAVQSHVCPLGLRCACVPVYYRARLVGIAKCVTHRRTDRRRFSAAVRILKLALEKASQDLCVLLQGIELQALRKRMVALSEMRLGGPIGSHGGLAIRRPNANGALESRTLVERVLDYICSHYLEHDAALTTISRKLGVTDKYLTCRFTSVVGQRMHTYIVQLRIQHACHALLLGDTPIKQVAYDSGFNTVQTFRRSFRRYVGVSPAAYRAAFLQR